MNTSLELRRTQVIPNRQAFEIDLLNNVTNGLYIAIFENDNQQMRCSIDLIPRITAKYARLGDEESRCTHVMELSFTVNRM